MTNQNAEHLIQKAKLAILSDIRKTLPGTDNLEIKVEAHGGIEYFEQALQLPEVQSALRSKDITASIYVIDTLSAIKKHILECIRNTPQGVAITFQALEKDADLYYSAASPEVKQVLSQRSLKIGIQVLDKNGSVKPDIIIATHDDIRKGRLEEYYE